MLKIYLARHGQDEDNKNGLLNGHRDEPLTELGLNQAKELADFIKNHHLSFDRVYSSPLQRAYVTAQQITTTLGITDPIILPALIERDFGSLAGEKITDIPRLCAPYILVTPTVTYFLEAPGAETFPNLVVRAQNLLDTIQELHQDGNILLVGHGDFGKMIYAAYYNLPWEEVLQQFHFGNSELILLAPDTQIDRTKIFQSNQFNS